MNKIAIALQKAGHDKHLSTSADTWQLPSALLVLSYVIPLYTLSTLKTAISSERTGYTSPTRESDICYENKS